MLTEPDSPAGWIVFTIPPPPSANNLYANVPGVGRVKTSLYRSWANTAGWQVRQQFRTLPHYDGFVYLDIDLRRGMDIDNGLKACFDLLQTPNGRRLKHGLGIIQDDNMIDELHIRRVPADRPFTVRLRAA